MTDSYLRVGASIAIVCVTGCVSLPELAVARPAAS
jgi:hypothetical protein